MTISIPAWLLWTLGIVVGGTALVVLLAFAWLGWQFARAWSKPRHYW